MNERLISLHILFSAVVYIFSVYIFVIFAFHFNNILLGLKIIHVSYMLFINLMPITRVFVIDFEINKTVMKTYYSQQVLRAFHFILGPYRSLHYHNTVVAIALLIKFLKYPIDINTVLSCRLLR